MATKFASIYKRELTNKGIISSMGSAVLKSAKERTDIRNVIFGGSGIFSATGQKIFGKGYSPTSADLAKPVVDAGAGATSELLDSSQRQERMLGIIAKNTFNMNMMARDMNITRQNIASLTKKITGKSSRGADALWASASQRNFKDTAAETKSPANAAGQSTTSFAGSVVNGLMGVAGAAGSGIMGALGVVMRLSPILGIIGLSGAAYVIKQLASSINFESIKESIASSLGIDLKSDTPILTQIANNMDEFFKTEVFTKTLKWIEDNFGPQVKWIGKQIGTAVDMMTVYSKAAFSTLSDSFAGIGKLFNYYINEFFQSNKGKILAAVTLGIMGPSVFTSLKGAALGAAVTALAGAYGYATGEKDINELKVEKENLQKNILDMEETAIKQGGSSGPYLNPQQKQLMKDYTQQLQDVEFKIQKKLAEVAAIQSEIIGAGRMQSYIEQYKSELPKRPDESSNTPTAIPSLPELSNVTFNQLSEAQKNALLNAQAASEGFNISGSLPNRMNNPGALKYAPTQDKFGATPGDSNREGQFAKFPTAEQGRAAQRDLWERKYGNVPIGEALMKWSPNRPQAYDANILKNIQRTPGTQIGAMSSELNATTRLAMATDTSAPVVVAPTTNVATNRGTPQQVASATNIDALDLFARQAINGFA